MLPVSGSEAGTAALLLAVHPCSRDFRSDVAMPLSDAPPGLVNIPVNPSPGVSIL